MEIYYVLVPQSGCTLFVDTPRQVSGSYSALSSGKNLLT